MKGWFDRSTVRQRLLHSGVPVDACSHAAAVLRTNGRLTTHNLSGHGNPVPQAVLTTNRSISQSPKSAPSRPTPQYPSIPPHLYPNHLFSVPKYTTCPVPLEQHPVQYTMHPKTPPSQTGVPATRQYGTSGRAVKVLANTFAIRTLPTQTIFHYDGEFCRAGRSMHMCSYSRVTPGSQLVRRDFSHCDLLYLYCALNLALQSSHLSPKPDLAAMPTSPVAVATRLSIRCRP